MKLCIINDFSFTLSKAAQRALNRPRIYDFFLIFTKSHPLFVINSRDYSGHIAPNVFRYIEPSVIISNEPKHKYDETAHKYIKYET